MNFEGDAFEANDEGYRLLHQGRVDEGLALLELSALAGIPWALATYSWHFLLSDRPGEAVLLAERALGACEQFTARVQDDPELAGVSAYQLSNARSNLALCRLAQGEGPEQARIAWQSGSECGHAESLFYPAVLAYRSLDNLEARKVVNSLPGPILAGLRASMREGVASGSSWFSSWCADGLAVLDLAPFRAPSADDRDLPHLCSLPLLGEAGGISSNDWELLGRAQGEDKELAELTMRRLIEEGGALAHAAQLELATLLLAIKHPASPDYREGWDLLIKALEAPYRDVVRVGAWNIAAELRQHGDSGASGGFARAALELGEPNALAHFLEEAISDEDDGSALHLARRALDEAPLGSRARTLAHFVVQREDAASLPRIAREWFVGAQLAAQAESLALHAPIYLWLGDYNVDSGAVSIATRYFEDCEEFCYNGRGATDCDYCGRSTALRTTAPSGAGDGGYSVFGLMRSDGETCGLLTVFLDAMAGRRGVGAVADLRDIIDPAAPLLLGELDAAGVLLVSDAGKSTDDRDVTVDVTVAPGRYSIVCWVVASAGNHAPQGPLPIALAAVGGSLRDSLLNGLDGSAPADPGVLINAMWGDPSRLVTALFVDIRPQVLANDAEGVNADGDDRDLSYLLQWAERVDAQEVHAQVRRRCGAGTARALELLERRGFRQPTLPWWEPSMRSNPEDVWGQALSARTGSLAPSVAFDPVWVRREAATNTVIRHETARVLASDSDERVRLNVARNPATPSEVVGALSGDPQAAVRAAATANPCCPSEILSRLAAHGAASSLVAGNPNTPSEAVGILAGSPAASVRARCASHPHVPLDAAWRLAIDSEDSVLVALAGNPAVPWAVIETLCWHTSPTVRSALAGHPEVPDVVLDKLSLDASEEVRAAAAGNRKASDELRAQASLLGTRVGPRQGSDSSLAAFCHRCGVVLVPDGQFCPGCGVSVAP